MSFTLTPQVMQALTIWAHSNNASLHWPSVHDEVLVRSQTPISGSPHPDAILALLTRIAALETTLATAQHEVAEMDAALRVVVPDIEARIHSTCVWCGTPAPQPTTTESLRAHVAEHVTICREHPMRGLEQHISDLEKSLETARKERDQHQQSAETWRKRVEQAAEALADVLPGEVGRLDLLARIQALKTDLARLKPSGQVAEDEAAVRRVVEYGPTNGEWEENLSRIAAKAQGYEAAVADNAALLAWIEEWGHAAWCAREHDKTLPCTDGCKAAEVVAQPHPGAALLERMKRLEESKQALRKNAQTMKKALVGIRKAYNSWTPEMGTRASWNEISYWLNMAGH